MNRKDQILQLLEANPGDAFLRFALAKEHEQGAGGDAGAVAIYEQLVRDSPDYVGTYYHYGKALERLGRDREAWAAYTTGIAVAGRLGENHARAELAGARLELGDEEDFG